MPYLTDQVLWDISNLPLAQNKDYHYQVSHLDFLN